MKKLAVVITTLLFLFTAFTTFWSFRPVLVFDHTNFLYCGTEHRATLVCEGADTADISVFSGQMNVRRVGEGKYSFVPSDTGWATVTVRAGDQEQQFSLRVKPVPDPVPMLGLKYKGGPISAEEFVEQGGLGAWIENFDLDAICQIVSFQITRLPASGPVRKAENKGGVYGDDAATIAQKATAGDHFIFSDIRVRCSGDKSFRTLPATAFLIR